MNHIFLDFEMNPVPRPQDRTETHLRNEIIQIGAVKLNEDYQLTERYSLYVRPELNTIAPHITTLTGITDKDVTGAPLLRDALKQFAAWIGEEPARIYAWSGTDRGQLLYECRFKEISVPRVFRRWMDFQKIYTRLMGLSRRSALSLKNAIGASESTFEGQEHSAVADAENAASLLTLVKDKEAFAQRTKQVTDFLKPAEQPSTTLGDLFAGLLSDVDFQEED